MADVPHVEVPRVEHLEEPHSDDGARRPGTRRGSVGSWWSTTAAIALGLFFGVVLLGSVWLLARAIALLILGVVIGEALAPIVGWLERFIPRLAAALLTYLALALVLVGLGFAILPAFIEQAQLIVTRVPDLIPAVQGWLERLPGLSAEDVVAFVTSQLGRISQALIMLPVAIVSSLLDILFIVFVSLYWLLQAQGRRNFTLSLFPAERREGVYSVAKGMGQAMGGFVRATVIDGVIVAVLSYIGLTIIGIDLALVLALFAGLLEFIPVIGPTIAAIPMIAIALADSPTKALIVLVFVLALQQFESNVLMPNVIRSQTEISPLLALLALFVGAALGGLLGALVAIPLAAGLRVFVVQVVAPGVRRWTGAELAEAD